MPAYGSLTRQKKQRALLSCTSKITWLAEIEDGRRTLQYQIGFGLCKER